MKIVCKTFFDCTHTGVTGSFKPSQMPFVDRANQAVNDYTEWNRSRNQQRNLETILQLIGLNAQPMDISIPQCIDAIWEFEFSVESSDVFAINGSTDPLAGLKQNCTGVPMIVNLTEKIKVEPVLCSQGPDQNIWFRLINTSME